MNPLQKWANILTFDIEAQNHEYYGRFASQFHPENWVVAIGWNYNGGTVRHRYYKSKDDVPREILPDLTNVDLIVGHNIKYDLLWVWDDPNLTEYLKRGGQIWDTQYSEYLLQGMAAESHMAAMNEIAEKYGGGLKVDAVKEMWESGVKTIDIPRDMLIEYLVGSKHCGNPTGDIVGDVMNTWLIFVGQMQLVDNMHPNFLRMCELRMDGLLATTECEYNGIYCAKERGAELRAGVECEVTEKIAILQSWLPKLPDELEFNWGSPNHKSALFFGGTVSYQKWTPHLDDAGQPTYCQQKVAYPLFRNKPMAPQLCRVSPHGVHYLPVPDGVPNDQVPDAITDKTGQRYLVQDKVKTGKNKGMVKTKQVTLPDFDKPKGAKQDYFFTFPGYARPDEKWESKNTDSYGKPLYGTGSKVIKKLLVSGEIPFLTDFVRYSKAKKDMETYYWKEDDEGNPIKGMLTLVGPDNLIHHSLNHTSTVTGRLSSSNPNGQNIPRGSLRDDGTVKGSRVKSMFTSRFGDAGSMGEVDYSQLEVVCLGVLTGDKQLVQDLNDGVDFHIKRLSAKLHRDYQELWTLHHVNGDPEIDEERTKAKVYSFQSQYGAGIATIAYDTGMTVDEVKALSKADEMLYPGVKPFYEQLDYIRETNSYQTGEHLFIAGERYPVRRGYWDSPTGTRYTWTEQETPSFIKEKLGKFMGFSPTELKNYPSQGLGGEIMQILLGMVFRYFLANDRFNGRVKLVNTVHDCLWLDGYNDILPHVIKQVSKILECVPQVLTHNYGFDVPVPFPVEAEIGPNMLELQVIH